MIARPAILIPVHDAPWHVEACLGSIFTTVDQDVALIIVDDGSGPITAGRLDAFAGSTSERPIHLLRHDRRRGFSAAVNTGLRIAMLEGFDPVLILNSDTVLLSDAVERLLDALLLTSHAAVGPLSNAAGEQSIPRARPRLRDRLLLRTARNDLSPRGLELLRGWVRAEAPAPDAPPSIVEVDRLHGSALACRLEALESVGLLDETTFPSGHGVEVDLAFRLRERGYTLAVATDAFVWHAGGASTPTLPRIRNVLRARRVLRRRYGKDAVAAARERTHCALALPSIRAVAERLAGA